MGMSRQEAPCPHRVTIAGHGGGDFIFTCPLIGFSAQEHLRLGIGLVELGLRSGELVCFMSAARNLHDLLTQIPARDKLIVCGSPKYPKNNETADNIGYRSFDATSKPGTYADEALLGGKYYDVFIYHLCKAVHKLGKEWKHTDRGRNHTRREA